MDSSMFREVGNDLWRAAKLAIGITLLVGAAIGFLCGMAVTAKGAEPLDLAILADTKPVAARSAEPLDLRILAEPVTAKPVEALDLTILSDTPVSKPAVKPSTAAKRAELGSEAGNQCRPVSALDWAYPTRGSHWTHPGTIRQHVLEGVHAGKLTAEQVAAMTDAELEAWHSDDHEGKGRKPVQVERVADATPAKKKAGTLNSDGVIYYEHRDGVYRAKKDDSCEYADPAKQSAPVYQQPAYQSGGCPGGVCPVNRFASPFRIFRRG